MVRSIRQSRNHPIIQSVNFMLRNCLTIALRMLRNRPGITPITLLDANDHLL
jgi:hypothetical protein